jgi:AcrR family transcriptional regulator
MPPLHLPPRAADATRDRRSRILRSAARAFAACGFKGASLRDIAADAEVSLTLVDHHFGSKEQLLEAVVARHHEQCKQRMVGFRNALLIDGHAATVAQLSRAWTRHEFELLQGEGGTDYLRLLIKLMNDEQVALGLRQTLDCSEAVVLHALTLAVPDATRDERGRAFRLARGAMHAALAECGAALDAGSPENLNVDIDSAADFVHAGLAASLH